MACLYPAQSDPEITQPLTMKTIFTTTGQIEGTTQHMHTYTHTYMYTKYNAMYTVHIQNVYISKIIVTAKA